MKKFTFWRDSKIKRKFKIKNPNNNQCIPHRLLLTCSLLRRTAGIFRKSQDHCYPTQGVFLKFAQAVNYLKKFLKLF